MQNGLTRSWTLDDCLFKLLEQYFVHKIFKYNQWEILNLSHKDKHNTKIKYRRERN